MALVIRPFNYLAGNTIIAEFHNSNETTLYNAINGNLTDANLGTVTEQAITFNDTGHEHGGGTSGSVINLSQVPTGSDTFLMKLFSTGDADALSLSTTGSSRTAVRAISAASDATACELDTSVAGGTALVITDSSNGSGSLATITGGTGDAGHGLAIVHNSTFATAKAAIDITMSDDVDHVGLSIQNNVEGIALRIQKEDAVTNVTKALMFVNNLKTTQVGSVVNFTSASTTDPVLFIQGAVDADGTVHIVNSGTTSGDTGILVSMTGSGASAHVGIVVDSAGTQGTIMSWTSDPKIGISCTSSSTVFQGLVLVKTDTAANSGKGVVDIISAGGTALEITAGASSTTAAVNITAANGAVATSTAALEVNRTGMTASERGGTGIGDEWVASFVNPSDVTVTSNCVFVGGLLRVTGDISKGGTSDFTNPYPGKSDKAIRYTCLEGPESGAYWRTRVTIPPDGTAYIEVPDIFGLAVAEGIEVDVLATVKQLCQVAAYHDVENNRIVVMSDLPGVEVSIFCIGKRRYFPGRPRILDYDWTEQRGIDGSPANQAYGPVEH